MGYVMQQDMKWFLRELEREELRSRMVTFFIGDIKMMVRNLRLVNRDLRWTGRLCTGKERIAVEVGNNEFYWDFPVDSWKVDHSYPLRGYGPATVKLEINAGDVSFELLAFDVITERRTSKEAQFMVLPEAHQRIRELEAEVKKAKDERDEAVKERDAARYERLRLEALINNLRGDLKTLLNL